MEKDKDFLGTEPIGKLLLRLAIPTLAAQLINMLYNVVDRIYIGHIPNAVYIFCSIVIAEYRLCSLSKSL